MRTRLLTGLMGLALTLGTSALVPKVAAAANPAPGSAPIGTPALPR